MFNLDPPDHDRLRKLVGKAFTMRRIQLLRPRIEQIAEQLLLGLAVHETVDLLADFAFPLPMEVISELLGVPQESREKFSTWSTALTIVTDQKTLEQTSNEMAAFFGRSHR